MEQVEASYETRFVVEMLREWEQLIEIEDRREARAVRQANCERILGRKERE